MPTPREIGKDWGWAKREEKRVEKFEREYGELVNVAKKIIALSGEVAAERKRGEKAWKNVFRLWPAAENAIDAVISRTNAAQHLFSEEQAQSSLRPLKTHLTNERGENTLPT